MRKVTAALLCALAACDAPADAEHAAAGEQDTASSVAQTTSHTPFCIEMAEQGLAFDAGTRESLRAGLGEPGDTRVTTTASGDSLFIVRYPGLQISLHKGAGGGELADQARVLDNRYLRHSVIGIGSAAEEVIATLGAPNTQAADEMVYVCHADAGRDDPLTFRLGNGRVTEIVYTWYMD